MITRKDILRKTHYGIKIFSYILRKYNPDEMLTFVNKNTCKPVNNPFIPGKHRSLRIQIVNNVAVFSDVFQDSEDVLPRKSSGDAFDFAQLHFKTTTEHGLLYTINKKLNLKLIDSQSDYELHGERIQEALEKMEVEEWSPKFSYYKAPIRNVYPSQSVGLLDVYKMVRDVNRKYRTRTLRTIKDRKKAQNYKANNFDYVTFSGIFSKRADKNLIQHSALLAVDFDHLEDIAGIKQKLFHDMHFDTELLFTSPSGDGLKWIIKMNKGDVSHNDYCIAISRYLEKQYSIQMDTSGQDISRACYLPYDPDVFINPKYTIHR